MSRVRPAAILKLVGGLLLLLSALRQLIEQTPWPFIDGVNLIFHEAGHMVFFFFGNTLYLLGGTILELLIPLVVTLHFYLRQAFFSAAFGAWWLVSACLSVSVYVSDARERALPLITNDPTTHDWWQLLGQWGLLAYDDVFGQLFLWLGILTTAFLINCLWHDENITQLVLPQQTKQKRLP